MRKGSLQRAFNAALPRRHGSVTQSKPTAAAIALWDAVLDTPRVLDGDLDELIRCVVEDETCINMQKPNGCTALYIAAEIGSADAVAEDHWPHLERVGTRCPVLQRAEKAAAAEKAERDLHGEERGPFWGRWDPLPASEAIAQHARAFASSEGFPTTHSEGMAQGGKGGRCPVLAAAAREEEEVVASAIPSGCPFHFESRREADERRMDPIESTHAARSDGSSDESSKEAKSASPTGPLSDGDGEGADGAMRKSGSKGSDGFDADDDERRGEDGRLDTDEDGVGIDGMRGKSGSFHGDDPSGLTQVGGSALFFVSLVCTGRAKGAPSL